MIIKNIDWNAVNDCVINSNNTECKESKYFSNEENVWMPEWDLCENHDPVSDEEYKELIISNEDKGEIKW